MEENLARDDEIAVAGSVLTVVGDLAHDHFGGFGDAHDRQRYRAAVARLGAASDAQQPLVLLHNVFHQR